MQNEDLIISMITELKDDIKELRKEVKEIKEDVNNLFEITQQTSNRIKHLEEQVQYLEDFEKKCLITRSSKLRDLLQEAETNAETLREIVKNYNSKKDLSAKVKEDVIKKVIWAILLFIGGIFASGFVVFLSKFLK